MKQSLTATAARRPWRLLAGLTALLVAAVSVAGTGALFTTQTVNPSNTFSSGILKVSSSASGAILTVSNMVPGDSATGTTTIANDGTVTGHSWTLAQSATSETPGTDPHNSSSHGLLSSKLNLKVEDQTAGTTVYDGVISGLSSASLTPIAPGAPHVFQFTVSFPGGGSDNAFEGGSLTESYTWSAAAGS